MVKAAWTKLKLASTAILIITISCSKQNSSAPHSVIVAGTTAETYLTDGPWVYIGTTVPGYPTNLYDSIFFTLKNTFNSNQFEDSIDGYYVGSRIVLYSFGKFIHSQSVSSPDTFITLFNPYTAGPTGLDTFLIKYLNDSLMVWGWYMGSQPSDYKIKYDSLKKERKY